MHRLVLRCSLVCSMSRRYEQYKTTFEECSLAMKQDKMGHFPAKKIYLRTVKFIVD